MAFPLWFQIKNKKRGWGNSRIARGQIRHLGKQEVLFNFGFLKSEREREREMVSWKKIKREVREWIRQTKPKRNAAPFNNPFFKQWLRNILALGFFFFFLFSIFFNNLLCSIVVVVAVKFLSVWGRVAWMSGRGHFCFCFCLLTVEVSFLLLLIACCVCEWMNE